MSKCKYCCKKFNNVSDLSSHINHTIECKKKYVIERRIKTYMPNRPTVLDLFCGCGGLTKGLTDIGFDVLFGIDVWNKAIDTYNHNFEHMGICADLTTLTPQMFEEQYNHEHRHIDVIVGGIPCQSFSLAGRRKGDDPRNDLFREYVKYLDYYSPNVFIIENVIGILSMKNTNGEKVIDLIMEQLTRNYNCVINKLYASDFEVPQNRRRVIICGVRKDFNHHPKLLEPYLTSERRIPVKNILESRETVSQTQYLSKRAIEGIIRKKEQSMKKGAGYGAQMLNMDKPSYTIPARYWKDGYDALVKYDDEHIRRLTIIELKRIQTFPDDFIFEGTKRDIITQIGNAVPCQFGYHIGLYVFNILRQLNHSKN
jgi:DNA (cytosine-5)-methyltransferase 1